MLWVIVFIAGVLGVLAGLIPLILNGMRAGNLATLGLGTLLLLSGVAGVIAKPSLDALQVPRVVFGEAEAPAPQPARVATVAITPDNPPAANPAPEPEADTAAKDESQLEPSKLPQPMTVTTTKVVGHEVDPLANPQAGGDAAPEPPAAAIPDPPAAVAAVAPPPAASVAVPPDTSALVGQQSAEERAFTKAVSNARDKYQTAGDDGRTALQSSRAAAICGAVKRPEVQNWVGSIREVDKDAGGRTIVTVALPDGTLVKTWNNAMSDVEDKTLILAGSPLANAFGQLAEGDPIRFSGSFFTDEPDCYRSSRLSLDQSMLEPSFLFRFTAVEKLGG